MEIRKTVLGLKSTPKFHDKAQTKIVKINICRPSTTGPMSLVGLVDDYYFVENFMDGDYSLEQITEIEFNQMVDALKNKLNENK